MSRLSKWAQSLEESFYPYKTPWKDHGPQKRGAGADRQKQRGREKEATGHGDGERGPLEVERATGSSLKLPEGADDCDSGRPIVDFWTAELWRKNVYCLKPLPLWNLSWLS